MATIDGITEWFTCDCCSHMISVTDLNTSTDPVPYVEVDLWAHPYAQRTDLWPRVRTAWQALRGRLHRDFVILDFPTAQRLGCHILAVSAPTHGWGCPKDGEPRAGDCPDCERWEEELERMQREERSTPRGAGPRASREQEAGAVGLGPEKLSEIKTLAGRGEWDLLEADVVVKLVEMAERGIRLSDRYRHEFLFERAKTGDRCGRCGFPERDPIHRPGGERPG